MATPMPAEIERYAALARIALRHYDLVEPAAEFLRHNENLIFRVSAAGGAEAYLLRLHRPAPSNFLVQSPASLESELLWLEAIGRETDIIVQRPVRNRRGQLVTAITPIGESAPLLCTLLTWIEGEPFAQDAGDAPQLAGRLGELLARLHNHASRWTLPPGFTRVTFGPEFLKRTVTMLKDGVERGLIRPQDYAVLDETAERIRSIIGPLPRDRQSWGVIHADLQGRNILVHESSVRPIDFSLCGFGHYLFDLGIALPGLKSHLRDPLLAGYRRRRPLAEDHVQVLEAYALFGMFDCYAFLLPAEDAHDWIRRRVPVAAQTYCRRLLAGERFLDQLRPEPDMNEIVDFAGNDYLGLARHPRVVQALQEAAGRYGVSSTASRWSIGWTEVHEQLERDLAAFCGSGDACIFGSAYLGGAIYYGRMAAAGRKVVFCDEMVHSSQYMGMRAAGLTVRPFRHLDVDDLQRQVAGYAGPPAIIATDGVYGISGETAPLAALARIAESIGAEVFVDDAHGFGVLGETGRGIAELCGVDPSRLTVLGSLSKALGTYGGVLAGGREFIDACHHSPEASGSSVPPTPVAAAALAALDLVRTEPSLRQKAFANAARMRQMLAEHGIGIVCDRHPIVGMLLRDEREAAALSAHFLSCGIRIPYFQYASEPRHNLLRGVARAIHTDEHLARFAKALDTRPGGH